MSEPTAYKRIDGARTARRFPLVFEMVADGRLHLTGITLLGPRLTEESHRELLEAAAHKSKREIEQLLAARFPRPEVPPEMRKLPERRASAPPRSLPVPSPAALDSRPALPAPGSAAAHAPGPTPAPVTLPPSATGTAADAATGAATASMPAAGAAAFTLSLPEAPRPEIKPVSAERFSIKMTVSRSVRDKLLEAQALMRHRQPNGDMEVVLERALDALLGQLRRDRYGETSMPRTRTGQAQAQDPKPGSRYISNEVKRIVAARDGHRCTFVDAGGNRCRERGFLEFDHIEPVAKGGKVDDPGNTRLRCHSHNAHAAEREFGASWMKRKIAAAVAAREAQRPARPMHKIAAAVAAREIQRPAQPTTARRDGGQLEPVPNRGDGAPDADSRPCPAPLVTGPSQSTGAAPPALSGARRCGP